MTSAGDWSVNGSGVGGVGFSRKGWVRKFLLYILQGSGRRKFLFVFVFCIGTSVKNLCLGGGLGGAWKHFALVRAGIIISRILILLL
jgi:hypothetical protein